MFWSSWNHFLLMWPLPKEFSIPDLDVSNATGENLYCLNKCKELRTKHWKTNSRAYMHALNNMFLMSERMDCKVTELLDWIHIWELGWAWNDWHTRATWVTSCTQRPLHQHAVGLTNNADVLAGLLESQLYFWPCVGRHNRPSGNSVFESAILKSYYLSNFCKMQARPHATINGAWKM